VSAAQSAVQRETDESMGNVVVELSGPGGSKSRPSSGRASVAHLRRRRIVGLELNPVGSGTAREPISAPGTHVTARSRVVVMFGR